MGSFFVGCSGFNYFGWKGRFYPPDLPQRKWLEFYSRVFKTVELNVTFYRLPKKETFRRWFKETPDDFSFSVKGSRFITHIKRLDEPEEPLEQFFRAAKALGEKLKIVLWQFPPSFQIDLEKFKRFVDLLPPYETRNAFEFRHPSWIDENVRDILKEMGYTYCMADWPPFIDDLPPTTNYVYLRRHGHGGNYASLYTREELERDAQRVKEFLEKGIDVYVYFNNDAYAYATQNARELIELVQGSRFDLERDS